VAAACGGQSVSIEEAPDAGSGGDGASGGSSSGGVGTGGRNVTGGAGGIGAAGGVGGAVGGIGAVGGVNVTGGVGATGGVGGKGVAGLGGSAGKGFGGAAGKGFGGTAGRGFGGAAGFGGSAGTEVGGFGGAIDDPCSPNPCLNAGRCVYDDGDAYVCDCAPGYAGIICQAFVGYCFDEPCLNGGTCTDTVDGFVCDCPPPFQGLTCALAGDGCSAEPCKNGGSCSDAPGGGFVCRCPSGLGGATCETGTITLPATARGWWDSSGRHDSVNDNTLTGFCSCGTEQNNSYFTFLLPDFSGNLASVTLRLEVESYQSLDAGEAYTVYDVSTDAMTLEATGSGPTAVPIYDDLMSGGLYSTFVVSSQSVGTIMSLDLLGVAVEDVDAARGSYFSVGVHLATYANRPNTPEYVRFSEQSEPRVHELVLNLVE
jgi:hypothetical protein